MKIKSTLEFDARQILEEKIDAGLAYGLRRCWKHSSEPTPDDGRLEHMREIILRAVMCEIDCVLKMDDS